MADSSEANDSFLEFLISNRYGVIIVIIASFVLLLITQWIQFYNHAFDAVFDSRKETNYRYTDASFSFFKALGLTVIVFSVLIGIYGLRTVLR